MAMSFRAGTQRSDMSSETAMLVGRPGHAPCSDNGSGDGEKSAALFVKYPTESDRGLDDTKDYADVFTAHPHRPQPNSEMTEADDDSREDGGSNDSREDGSDSGDAGRMGHVGVWVEPVTDLESPLQQQLRRPRPLYELRVIVYNTYGVRATVQHHRYRHQVDDSNDAVAPHHAMPVHEQLAVASHFNHDRARDVSYTDIAWDNVSQDDMSGWNHQAKFPIRSKDLQSHKDAAVTITLRHTTALNGESLETIPVGSCRIDLRDLWASAVNGRKPRVVQPARQYRLDVEPLNAQRYNRRRHHRSSRSPGVLQDARVEVAFEIHTADHAVENPMPALDPVFRNVNPALVPKHEDQSCGRYLVIVALFTMLLMTAIMIIVNQE
eukprot:TRINITY_DN60283_c0_g1_i1.p1 TRINITY_DN60283_c0_g1~~TRINITY_DN60283_c0_g1_i1.p1  ORF type:complete len:380 (+),score=137.67 TRINITY_DN60283_c0_g1_i1:64-1203(+)